jgi:hypothetical protein
MTDSSSRQFRIEFVRPGIKYEFKYAKTVKAAITAAHTREYLVEKPAKHFSKDFEKPVEAHITERIANTWELVAKVDAKGVHVVLRNLRESFKRANTQLQRIQKQLEETQSAIEAFHREVARVLLEKRGSV